MTDKYKLPEPEYLGWDYERLLVKPIKGYTESQMQQAYQAGRDSMKAEAVKACGDFDIPDIVEGAHPDYVEGKRMAVAQIAYKIGTLK